MEWNKFLTPKEIEMINEVKKTHISHPLQKIINKQDYDNFDSIRCNTEESLRILRLKDSNWLDKIKPRLLDTNDFSHSRSALGEIRTYGYLLLAGFNVKPIMTSINTTPDFEIHYNNIKIKVETATKGMSEQEAKSLNDFYNSKYTSSFRVHSTAPFNHPKNNDENITENAVSKICSIKGESRQLTVDNDTITILWIDFQNEDMSLIISDDNLKPYRSFNGELTSGEIWYAFYGKKELPILEGYHIYDCSKMKHDGRYVYDKKPDYTVISFAKSTVILENHNSLLKLSDEIILLLLGLPRFKIESSILRMTQYDLERVYEKIKWLYGFYEQYHHI